MSKDEALSTVRALKLALEALEAHADIGIKSDKAITAIKEALMSGTDGAQPEPEYLAFMDTPQRKPLTDEEVRAVIRAGEYDSMEEFARAIEAAHGIKGEA